MCQGVCSFLLLRRCVRPARNKAERSLNAIVVVNISSSKLHLQSVFTQLISAVQHFTITKLYSAGQERIKILDGMNKIRMSLILSETVNSKLFLVVVIFHSRLCVCSSNKNQVAKSKCEV